MDAHDLRAPTGDGSLLARPPLKDARALLEANAARLASWDFDLQGRRASRLRSLGRIQVLDRARAFHKAHGLDLPPDAANPAASRLIVTGHQPELFHPGVWIKNFAVSALASRPGTAGLNLIVDNDIPKSTALKVPRREGAGLRRERLLFDDWSGEIPYEDLKVADEAMFASFGDRARTTLGDLVPDPILNEFWPRAVAARGLTNRLGLRFAIARAGVEASWGVRNWEVPLSMACETEGFHWFACHLLANLPRFQQVHNEALERYRLLHGIRSRNHPVAALSRDGDWRETPFWAWRAARPRRRPLMARQLAKTLELRLAGDSEILAELPLSPDRDACCAVEQLSALQAKGVRLRTRALTTTVFARYFLGDLFIHGIGGAKYDELGDAISGAFYGIEPPAYLTLSLTLWLGLGSDPEAAARLAAAERTRRDLDWNPDRHLDDAGRARSADWREAKRKAIAGPVGTHAERRARYRELRRVNDALRDLVAEQARAADEDVTRWRGVVERDAIARSREYAAVLHSTRRFQEALQDTLRGVGRGEP